MMSAINCLIRMSEAPLLSLPIFGTRPRGHKGEIVFGGGERVMEGGFWSKVKCYVVGNNWRIKGEFIF